MAVKGLGVLSHKASSKSLLILLLVLSVPAFFWFRYLYLNYFVLPDQISAEQQKMADSMKREHEKKPNPAPAPKKANESAAAGSTVHVPRDQKGDAKPSTGP